MSAESRGDTNDEQTQLHQRLEERLQAGLTEDEREFLVAAEIGDFDLIKKFIESKIVSVHVVDPLGRTGLEVASNGDHEEIVSYLLKTSSEVNIQRALLSAIENDRDHICDIILEHPMYHHEARPEIASKATDGAELQSTEGEAPPLKPKEPIPGTVAELNSEKTNRPSKEKVHALLKEALIQAALKDNFQIIKLVILMGVTLDSPHDYFCICNDCISGRTDDFMMYSTRRLDTFRAMASPGYIALTEDDPIVASFHLSVMFRKLAEIETEYKSLYNELDDQCQDFAINLMDQCRSSEEVKTLLTYENASEDSVSLPVIDLAIRMEQKKFISHSKTQAQVSQLWFQGLPALRYLNRFSYLMLAIPVGMVCIPVLSIVYLIAPWSRVTFILETPLMKFLSYTCSYMTFLCLLVASKLNFGEAWASLSCEKPEVYAIIVILIIILWIAGLIWEESKQIYTDGALAYFVSFWNIVDSTMLSFFLASFVLEIIVPLKLRTVFRHDNAMNISGNSGIPLCQYLREDGSNSVDFCTNPPIGKTLQIVWDSYWTPDPELLSDVFFSIATVLSVSRFSFVMPANETFGTMLVSFRRTFGDVIKLCGMFILVLVAFTCGMAALYDANMCQSDNFGSVGMTLFILTWSMFGMGDTYAPKIDKQGPMNTLINDPARNVTTEAVGFVLYGMYVFASMIVLMNLLIAMMSNTFQEVQDDQEVEWKFARTELWLTFIAPGSPIPPPFNVFPSPKSISWVWGCGKNYLKRHVCTGPEIDLTADDSSDGKKGSDYDRFSYSSSSASSKRNRQDVISMLVRRFVRHAEREKIEEDGDAGDDMTKKLIERVAMKLEKRLEDLQVQLEALEINVTGVTESETNIKTMQVEQLLLTKKQMEEQERERDEARRRLEEELERRRKREEDRLKRLRPPSPDTSSTSDEDVIPTSTI